MSEIDPSLDRVVASIRGLAPGGLAAVGTSAGDTVWASDPSRHLVLRIDGKANEIVRRIHLAGRPTRIADDDRAVWVVTAHALWRIDARTNKPVANIRLPVTAKRVMLAAGSVWVTGYRWSNHLDSTKVGTVIRIDPDTNRVLATIVLGDVAADGMTVARNLIWVAAPPSA